MYSHGDLFIMPRIVMQHYKTRINIGKLYFVERFVIFKNLCPLRLTRYLAQCYSAVQRYDNFTLS